MPIAQEKKLPIAEVFTSIHGEGAYAGTPMTFFRLAGCTVGRAWEKGKPQEVHEGPFALLPSGRAASICTTFDGRTFPCDTDYSKSSDQSMEDLLSQIPNGIKHVCITGGEPLMHASKLFDLLKELTSSNITVHFETSGTFLPPVHWGQDYIYWACSPKKNYLPHFVQYVAHEIRIMVDRDLKFEDVERLMYEVPRSTPVFFAPLTLPDNVMLFDPASMSRARDLAMTYGGRVSIQMHKVLGVR
jgi:organic radical activating enzyme